MRSVPWELPQDSRALWQFLGNCPGIAGSSLGTAPKLRGTVAVPWELSRNCWQFLGNCRGTYGHCWQFPGAANPTSPLGGGQGGVKGRQGSRKWSQNEPRGVPRRTNRSIGAQGATNTVPRAWGGLWAPFGRPWGGLQRPAQKRPRGICFPGSKKDRIFEAPGRNFR